MTLKTDIVNDAFDVLPVFANAIKTKNAEKLESLVKGVSEISYNAFLTVASLLLSAKSDISCIKNSVKTLFEKVDFPSNCTNSYQAVMQKNTTPAV